MSTTYSTDDTMPRYLGYHTKYNGATASTAYYTTIWGSVASIQKFVNLPCVQLKLDLSKD